MLFLLITSDRQHPVDDLEFVQVHDLERNLRTYGSFAERVNDQKRRRGDAFAEQIEEQQLAYVGANLGVSTRRVGGDLGISYTAARKIFKEKT